MTAAIRTVPNIGTDVLINFVAFQLGWWCCVLGAAQNNPLIGPFAVALIVLAHLLRARGKSAESLFIVCAVALGAVGDSALMYTGWIVYPSTWIDGIAPLWILALWAVFATTINVSMRWLHGRDLLAAVLGAIAAPLSYWGGVRLGAATFVHPTAALIALACGWALAMPLLLWLAQRLDGYAAR
ncbi:MAG: DUF2878 domain-containing protein [Spongiibacteraceae bacterium]